ncbi:MULTISPECIES: hypothetical protein [unclassified Acinetobacter]|uniref:hypothetical protein n=1 Tax=unclassified Acinetobacter TaxID=196816 RepID=UPI002578CDE7|nr:MULTISPECIES: hypothetical protein [unclassified Acinetobacter]MDM1756439.1 hypothetical protein [Acinetobacter sp. 256-1]MDM1761607.1 hypothetical protein [Acinetobacter sp. 251-1]
MLNEDRENYFAIKSWVLETYYDGCRDLAFSKGWNHLEILAYTFHQFENSFDSLLENFMLLIIQLTLTGSWEYEIKKNLKSQIDNLIKMNDVKSLIHLLPENEADEFMRDLEILNIQL